MSLSRFGIVTVALAGLLTLGVGTASAHVAVSSADATPGGEGKVTFRVPDESDTASTVKLRIQLPTKTPLASVAVLPVPGWTFTATKEKLAKPVVTDDGDTLTDRVSVVEFDAVRGGGIAPGEFQEFSLSVGPIPKVDSLAFSVVQSYSDGKQVAWIEPTIAGAPEPQHPAPVLTLTGAAAAATPTAAAAADHTDHTTTTSSSGAATWIALVALLIGLVGVVLGWDARRRTVAS
ncbi:MAG: YcnI family copper-binding membrane protein [Blastococcus sp.]